MRSRLLVLIAACLTAFPCMAQKEGEEYKEAGKKGAVESVLMNMPADSRHESLMLPMKDGIKLAVDVFTPPGEGPWPVIFAKGYYGHFSTSGYASPCKAGGFVFVAVDARGKGNSEKGKLDPKAPDYEVSDCNELIEWISRQPWCNGKIGTHGGSGNGIASYCSFLTKHPNLAAASPGNSSAYTYNYWGFNNGVKRATLYNWLNFVGIPKDEWPKPTLNPPDLKKWGALLDEAAQSNGCVFTASAGWYDMVSESAIELFMHCGAKAKVFVSVGPNAHGGEMPFNFPRNNQLTSPVPKFEDVLLGKAKVPEKSAIVYFVMGDRNDKGKSGIGNVVKVSETWPPASARATDFYLQADGSLKGSKSSAEEASLSYTYDPNDPAPTIGGNWMYSKKNIGAYDQRPLLARKDVLRFATEPLTEPVEIAGKVFAELCFSTDVPDTEFVVKLVDIYPDGYEMIVRESAGMARYANGLDQPAPVKKGEIRKLLLDMWSTAIAFDKGHRIGVYVTSSSKDAYEVHPNTWEQVMDYTTSPVANNTIHCSAGAASRLILPVVKN